MPTTPQTNAPTTTDLVALALGLTWVLGVGVYLLFAGAAGAAPGSVLVTILVLLVPPLVLWLVAAQLRMGRVLRAEIAALRLQLTHGTPTTPAQSTPKNLGHVKPVSAAQSSETNVPAPEKRLDRDRAATRSASKPGGFASRRAPKTPPPAETQPRLDLDAPHAMSEPPISTAEIISALNFPTSADDAEGFRILRRVRKDPLVGKLIQASEDVLTLLSKDALYVDDLAPDRARPEIWRKFAAGERGRTVAALGGIRDRASLSLVASRMKQDPIFRDATHHFLRQFDHGFARFAETASDAEIVALSDTRTARAFMLLGRATGTFD